MTGAVRPGVANLPRAHGGPAGRGRLRARPEHFFVVEELGFEPDGTGEHALLTVRKEDANTQWVARCLARQAGVAERDVGYAGLKDRHSVAQQFYTVPIRAGAVEDWRGFAGEGFRVESVALTRRKLRRGAHRGNAFRLTVTDLDADPERLRAVLERIARHGVPNYFGRQRFGHAGANLERAWMWFTQNAPPRGRGPRSFALSAARAAIFNAVLAERVLHGTWDRLTAGDVANLANTRSIFRVDAPDERLEQRCRELDVHPTGPLWGRGEPVAGGAIAELEHRLCEPYRALADGLAAAGMAQERRALRVAVADLEWSFTGPDLVVAFRLPRGAFATVVVHELIDYTDDAASDED